MKNNNNKILIRKIDKKVLDILKNAQKKYEDYKKLSDLNFNNSNENYDYNYCNWNHPLSLIITKM